MSKPIRYCSSFFIILKGKSKNMVTEYHLNLGPRDTLKKVVHDIQKLSGIKSSEKKSVLVEYLSNCQDSEINKQKRTLIKNVPYRLQAPFISQLKGKDWNISEMKLAARINQEKRLIYYFDKWNGMKTTIRIQEESVRRKVGKCDWRVEQKLGLFTFYIL